MGSKTVAAPERTLPSRALIKALKKGQAVGMLPDQAPKVGEGVWLKFFGRWAYTMTLAGRLTETGATTLMAWGERLPRGRGYVVHIAPFDHPLPVGDGPQAQAESAAAINHLIDQRIVGPAQRIGRIGIDLAHMAHAHAGLQRGCERMGHPEIRHRGRCVGWRLAGQRHAVATLFGGGLGVGHVGLGDGRTGGQGGEGDQGQAQGTGVHGGSSGDKVEVMNRAVRW